MRYLIAVLLYLASQSAASNDVQSRVNFHLTRTQTLMEKNYSQGKVNALQTNDLDSNQSPPAYFDPHFGIGDEYGANIDSASAQVSADVPKTLSPREEIEREALKRKSSSVTDEDNPEVRERFLEEFRKNAAKRGVKVKIDPVTLEVREVR